MRLHVAIAVGLVAGLLFGLVANLSGVSALIDIATGIAPVGTAFVNLLKMVVIPLVVGTLFVGVAGLGDLARLGKLGGWTLGFFGITTVVGILIGMGVMALMLPLMSQAARDAAGAATAVAPELPSTLDFLLGLIPDNPFRAAAEGALLPLIVFTSFFGAAAGALPDEHRLRLMQLGDAVVAAMIKLVHWVLWTAPIGIFALASPVTAQSGWAMLQSLIVFVVAIFLGLATFIAAVYLPAVHFLAGVRVSRFLKALPESAMISFATTSSAATVPAMLDAADRLKLAPVVSSFVIALGAAVGRAGSALFQGGGIVFLAWLYQVPLSVGVILSTVFATALVSVTVAGVPSASIFTMAPAVAAAGIPLDGLGVLLGVDRIPDMLRTATNVTGTMSATALMDRLVASPPARE